MRLEQGQILKVRTPVRMPFFNKNSIESMKEYLVVMAEHIRESSYSSSYKEEKLRLSNLNISSTNQSTFCYAGTPMFLLEYDSVDLVFHRVELRYVILIFLYNTKKYSFVCAEEDLPELFRVVS